ncbi:MAG: S1C family serine protease [Armatimonadota bacterium]
MSNRSGRFWWSTVLMAGGFLLGSWLAPRVRVEWEPGPLPHQALAQTPAPRAAVTADEPVARAVDLAGPSVVNIDTVRRVVRDDWFLGERTFESSGKGSGVVIDPRGYVLTNEHVVAGASEINVTFGNGKSHRGRVLGIDRETDVALVQILDAKNVPVARLGDSRNLVAGQWAIAIGNPYGYEQTVTVGVVGHTGRAMQIGERVYKRLIQTDAAINPGNSGGPLVDIQGRVIGINTVVRSDAQGIGFAIPIDLAKGIADELIAHGKVKRPWTGLNTIDVTPEIASWIGLERPEGALVDRIDRRGPAWQAGVRPGDIIRELEGKKIRSRAEAEAITSAARIGDKLSIVVEREGELFKGEIVVTDKP